MYRLCAAHKFTTGGRSTFGDSGTYIFVFDGILHIRMQLLASKIFRLQLKQTPEKNPVLGLQSYQILKDWDKGCREKKHGYVYPWWKIAPVNELPQGSKNSGCRNAKMSPINETFKKDIRGSRPWQKLELFLIWGEYLTYEQCFK